MDRTRRQDWEKSGGRTMGDRAQEKLDRLLTGHAPVPLDQGVQAQIDAILTDAEKRNSVAAA
jgi:trimethylamine:corrinoid methyltransferase-like protein